MNAFIAFLASSWPPFAHAALTRSVLNSVWMHAAGAASSAAALEALKVASVSAPAMERMLAINPSLDIEDDPWLLVLASTAWPHRLFSRRTPCANPEPARN